MKAFNIILWVLQVLVAVVMILHGYFFLFPTPELQKMMAEHPSPFAPAFMKFIFAMEFLGGIGLILPAATRILPVLTPLAALGLAIIMGGAVYTHLTGEPEQVKSVGVPLALLVFSLIIAWGRGRVAVIPARTSAPHPRINNLLHRWERSMADACKIWRDVTKMPNTIRMPKTNNALWVLQFTLAIAFFSHSVITVISADEWQPVVMQSFPQMQVWVAAVEIAGAFCLLFPSLTRILPVVAPVTAAFLSLMTLVATIASLWMESADQAFFMALLTLFCAFVAKGRSRFVPIPPRSFASHQTRLQPS